MLVVVLAGLVFCVFVFCLIGKFAYCDLWFWDFGGLVSGLGVVSGFVWVYYLWAVAIGCCYG